MNINILLASQGVAFCLLCAFVVYLKCDYSDLFCAVASLLSATVQSQRRFFAIQ